MDAPVVTEDHQALMVKFARVYMVVTDELEQILNAAKNQKIICDIGVVTQLKDLLEYMHKVVNED